ncbi:MAG TPA: type II toxin-antitoxin system VapC family toxin [bacterium]
MVIVDSSGWIEYFRNGMLAERFEKYLADLAKVVVPTVIIYEVYKKIKKEKGEDQAVQIVGQMLKGKVVTADAELMVLAGDLGIKHAIPMVDAIVYATSVREKCPVVSSDPHLEKLENVVYVNPDKYKHTPGVG